MGDGESKKQILLPSGEWILLAALDGKIAQGTATPSSHRQQKVDLTTLAFGKFDGTRLVSLMRFTVSSKKTSAAAWSDLSGCDEGGPARLYHARAASWRGSCIGLRVSADPLRESSTVRDEVRKSLTKLGAKIDGVALVSVVSFAERQSGYLGVSRVDWPGYLPAFGSDKEGAWRGEKLADDSARTAYVKSLLSWAHAYAELAQKGLTQEIDQADLTAEGHPREAPSTIVLDDFDPLRAAN